MRWSLMGLMLVFGFLPSTYAQRNSQFTVRNSHRGFDKQYKEVFHAFRRSDERELRLRFDDFGIPTHWFTDTFGADVGPKLAVRYAQEFEKFVYATCNLFGSVDAAHENSVGTHVWKYDHGAN